MEIHRSPLLDMFQRGDVPKDVRLMAARGELGLRAAEELTLLALLAHDADPEVVAAAEFTLAAIPKPLLVDFLGRTTDLSAETRAFFAERGVVAPNPGPGASSDPDATLAEELGLAAAGPEEADGGQKLAAVARIAAMTVAERMRLAFKGTREERSILIRDPNRLVCTAVLSSPKVKESDIESFAKMANVSEEVLRIIGKARAWTRHYAIVNSLVRNPKTPLAISLPMISRLVDRDVRSLSIDRNVPEPLRIAARKLVIAKDSRKT